MGRGVKIPWVGGSIYHGYGGRYSMGRGVDIPWVGVKIPWVGGKNTMARGLIHHG